MLAPGLVFIDAFEHLLLLGFPPKGLEEGVAEEEDDSCHSSAYQIAQVLSELAVLPIPLVFMRPEIDESWRNFERKRHQSIPSGCPCQTIRKACPLFEELCFNLSLFGALKAGKPLHLTSSVAEVGKVLREREILDGSTGRLTEIAGRNEDCPILDVVAILRPAHRVMLSVSSRVVHVMHHVHVRVEDKAVYDVACEGKVVEARGEE
jgi:hypothetical protein